MTCGGQMRWHWKHEVHNSWPVASSYSKIGKLRNASGSASRSSGYWTVKTPVVSLGVSSFLVKAPTKCLITTSRPASIPWPARSLGLPRSITYALPRANSTVISMLPRTKCKEQRTKAHFGAYSLFFVLCSLFLPIYLTHHNINAAQNHNHIGDLMAVAHIAQPTRRSPGRNLVPLWASRPGRRHRQLAV